MASAAPPPLKKRRREEPADLGLDAPRLDLSDIALEVAAGPHEDEPTDGEWVFKQDDVVLGPVSAAVLVQRIEKGELEGATPVGREAGKWQPLKSVPYFKEILDKAEARRRALEEQLEAEARRKREGRIRLAAMAALVAVPFLVGTVAGRAVMVARPWDDTDDWLKRPPPLVDLPPKPKEAPPPPPPVKTVQADEAAPAEPEAGEEEAAGKPKPKPKQRVAAASSSAAKKKAAAKRASQKQAKAAAKKPEPPAPKQEKLAGALTQKQVMAPVMKSQGAIGACLKAEASRNADMPSRVTLMWTVTEEGRAVNFKLKERQVRGGPLPACLKKVFNGMRWPKFRGERKNVELPLSVKK